MFNTFVFYTFHILFWNNRRLLSVVLEPSISRNTKNSLRVSSFYFSSSESYFLKYKSIKLHFWKPEKSSVMQGFWIYLSCNIGKFSYVKFLNIPFLKYKKSPISWNIIFFRCFRLPKYKNRFLLKKYNKFFNIRARKLHFLQNIFAGLITTALLWKKASFSEQQYPASSNFSEELLFQQT